jgi:hypothetical protein
MKVHNVIPTVLVKEAFDFKTDTPLKDFKPNNPNQTGIAGAALGALAAGGGAYLGTSLFDSLNDSPRPRASKIKRALMAALIGAGVGGAAGYTRGQSNRTKRTDELMNAITAQTGNKEQKIGDKLLYSLSPKAGDREMFQDTVEKMPLSWYSEKAPSQDIANEKSNVMQQMLINYLRNDKGILPRKAADLMEEQRQLVAQMQNQNKPQ